MWVRWDVKTGFAELHMLTKSVSIPVGEMVETSGVVCLPENHRPGTGTGVILAHGAGNDMTHPLLATLSHGLTQAGYVTLRFNFPYRERGRRTPDPQSLLVLTWRSVYEFLQQHDGYATKTVVAAGKSMGGRVASQMVSEGLLPVSGLIFFGYPLHSPSNKEKMRDAHLYGIKTPMLFIVGTRDRLCDIGQLRMVLNRLKLWDLETIEGGDHSFRLPKSAGIAKEDVYDRILDRTLEWLETSEERR